MSADLSIAFIGAVAIIIASIVGLIVAVATAIISKEQKVSEFRQEWINDLRSDLAISLQSAYNCMYESQNNPQNFSVDKYNQSFRELEFRFTLINLRLNPIRDNKFKKLSSDLLSLIHSITTAADKKVAVELCQSTAKEIENLSHRLLKNEWERVKRGENRFSIFKKIGKFCAGMLLIAIYILFAVALIRSPIFS